MRTHPLETGRVLRTASRQSAPRHSPGRERHSGIPSGACQLPLEIGESTNQLWRFEGPVTLPDAQLGKQLGFNEAGRCPICRRHTPVNQGGGRWRGFLSAVVMIGPVLLGWLPWSRSLPVARELLSGGHDIDQRLEKSCDRGHHLLEGIRNPRKTTAGKEGLPLCGSRRI